MAWLVLLSVAILSFIIGFLVKFVDFIEDDLKLSVKLSKTNLKTKGKSSKLVFLKKISFPLGILYGLLIAFVLFIWPILFPLAIGTILGEVVARKIDVVGHFIALFIFVLLCAFLISLGLLNIGLNLYFVALALVFLAASLIDEYFDKYGEKAKGKYAYFSFFSFRPFLEITAFFVSLVSNEWIIWITILAFDLAYVLSTKFLPKVFFKLK